MRDIGKRNVSIIIILLFICFIVAAEILHGRSDSIVFFWSIQPPTQVCIDGKCFKVEIAKTPQQRERGLMYRDSLATNSGMLFVFEQEGNYPFWMKNTKIPLDMIWTNKDKKVVFIAKNVRPCDVDQCPNIISDKTAMYVLEINAGLADKIGIKQGDGFDFKL
jgi:hypothetical protein